MKKKESSTKVALKWFCGPDDPNWGEYASMLQSEASESELVRCAAPAYSPHPAQVKNLKLAYNQVGGSKSIVQPLAYNTTKETLARDICAVSTVPREPLTLLADPLRRQLLATRSACAS